MQPYAGLQRDQQLVQFEPICDTNNANDRRDQQDLDEFTIKWKVFV